MADAQPAAVLSRIRPLHVFDPANARGHPSPSAPFALQSQRRAAALPDSREETRDAIGDALEVVDGVQFVFSQILAILGPNDGVVEISVGNVHGAVERHLVALRQSDSAHGGFKVKLPELVRGQIDPGHCGWYHMGLCPAVDVAAGMLGCLQKRGNCVLTGGRVKFRQVWL